MAPPSPFKEKMAEVSECQRARICFTFPKCHGIWAACTNEKPSGVEEGMQRTWVKHGRKQGAFSTSWLITARALIDGCRSLRAHTHTHTHNYSLTFGRHHDWLRCGTCRMKLWLKVVVQHDAVLCPCESTTQSLLLSLCKGQQKDKVM